MVLNLDITNYGPKNADGFTSMIFTSPVPSPKQKEHSYMCSSNTSTFEETIRLEECNPCEIPGFILQLDLDFLLDLAKKTAQFSWYDIYSTAKNIGAFVPIFIFLCLTPEADVDEWTVKGIRSGWGSWDRYTSVRVWVTDSYCMIFILCVSM